MQDDLDIVDLSSIMGLAPRTRFDSSTSMRARGADAHPRVVSEAKQDDELTER